MKLNVIIDNNTIKRILEQESRGMPLTFAIFWENEGDYYPDYGWNDFGTVLLAWWTGAAKRLKEGAASVELVFMDGPFRLIATKSNRNLMISSVDDDYHSEISMNDFLDELSRALDYTIASFENAKVSKKSVEGLKTTKRHLQSIL